MNSEIQTYPLNADKLEKGDTINQAVIADFLGVPLNSKAYELGVLGLADKVRRAMESAGKAVTVVVTRRSDPISAGGIRVLTDSEALRFNSRGFKLGLRRAARKHRKTMDIDPSKLTSEEQRQFERSLVVQGAIMSAVVKTRVQVALKAVQRNAPPMISHEE